MTSLIDESKTPGLQYLVVTPTEIGFECAVGWADLRRRVRMDPRVTLMAYSMSKTITAAAVLQLVERGEIGLDTPATQYLSFFPYGPAVTVRHLLSHTSGIPNPIPLRWVHVAQNHESFDETAALTAVLRRHPRLSFTPGTRYRYSNIGYWLLGSIVERVAGAPLSSYVCDQILRPLGIERDDLGYSIPDRDHQATGYLEKYSLMNVMKGFLIDRTLIGDYDGPWLRIGAHYPNGTAFGGLVGTARGFGTFLQDQLRPHSALFGESARRLFYGRQQTRGGKSISMTLGWHIGGLRTRPFFYKEGGGGGFHTMMRLYPEARMAAVMMTNATGCDVRGAMNRVDPYFVE